ncbi:MAG: sulfatase-like hydrolase/transferase [Pseudomonadota bacterium]
MGHIFQTAANLLVLPIASVALLYGYNVNRIDVATLMHSGLFVVGCFAVFLILIRVFSRWSSYSDTFTGCLFIGLFLGKYFAAALFYPWVLLWLLIAIAGIWNDRVRSAAKSLVKAVGFCFLGLAAYHIIASPVLWERTEISQKIALQHEKKKSINSTNSENRDIYYIVLDRYARADQLSKIYGYDNSPFLKELESRGFIVASQSYSNYPRTAHSLSSSLNLDYLNSANPIVENASSDWTPIYNMIENSAVTQFLNDKGYAFHFFGSWWEPTRTNKYAEAVINHRAWPEIVRVLFENSLFGEVSTAFDMFPAINPRQLQCDRAKNKFAALQELPKTYDPENPKFVFAHFLVPHPPFVIDAQGNCISVAEAEARTRNENYVEQVKFANGEILKFLESVSNSDKPSPIIILQADEGPWPKKYARDEIRYLGRDVSNVNWTDASASELREKMAILNALYLPEQKTFQISPNASPVNNFRLVFREYFGADLPELQNQSYIFMGNDDLYNFQRVDDKLNSQ